MSYSWTFMVYMAGDNGKIFDGKRLWYDLQQYGWANLAEMSSVGSTGQVAIVAQYDTLEEQYYTPRLFIDGSKPCGRQVEALPPVNTGDPRNLTDFITWATKAYPAERYALILWNHGDGWKEDDIYARYRDQARRAIRGGEVRAGSRGDRLRRRALFLETVGDIMSIEDDDIRGICYDDSSKDFLDMRKLAQALADAEAQTQRRLSVLGMDACLMATAEVAWAVREHADYMVGSQEVEEGYGWPYGQILKALVEQPAMPPSELAKLIVARFGAHYLSNSRGGGGKNTLSAIDLGALPQTFDKTKTLASSITSVYRSDIHAEVAVQRAKLRAQASGRDKDSLDLKHFSEIVRDEYVGKSTLGGEAADLALHLEPTVPDSPIVANFNGSGRPHANGLSVYFPPKGCSPYYAWQAFTASQWDQVIRLANEL